MLLVQEASAGPPVSWTRQEFSDPAGKMHRRRQTSVSWSQFVTVLKLAGVRSSHAGSGSDLFRIEPCTGYNVMEARASFRSGNIEMILSNPLT